MPDLSDALNWSEVDADNNNPAPNGWPEGMMPSGVNDAARADRGALKRFWDKINPVQVITPVSGLYTFTTTNAAYPTAYVDGEIYCFHPTDPSVGGDYFQVNALDPAPIWKRAKAGPSGFLPIIAQDIQPTGPVQLVYMAFLNHGAGAFILLNPFVPLHGDGVGGVSANGTLTVNGGDLMLGRTDEAYSYILRPATPAGFNNLAFAATGGLPLNDVSVITNQMEVTGRLAAPGYSSRSGLNGPYQSNVFNIEWRGTAAHLWIDTTDVGPIAIASGGDIVVGGSITGGSITSIGDLTAGGNLHVAGSETVAGELVVNSTGASSGGVSIYATAGAIRSDVAGTALYLPNGDISAENMVLAGTTAGGAGSNLAILCTNGGIQSSRAGTAFYAPNGNVVCQGISTAGSVSAGSLGVAGTSVLNGQVTTNNIECEGSLGVVGPSVLNGVVTTNNINCDGNLTVSGTINGHPAMTMFAQLDALAARVAALEAR